MDSEKVGRRALIRRAATLAAAGIGGIAATEMLTASPASAATGNMQFGATNTAGVDKTILTSTADSATFEVAHTGKIANVRLKPVDDSVDYGGPSSPAGDPLATMLGGELINLTETVDTGTGSADIDTLFWMAGDNANGDLANLAVVLTTATGTVFAPYAYTDSNGAAIGPYRVLDTRSTAGRLRLSSQTVLDSSHRLIGGKTLEIQLDDFVKFAYAVHINVTAVTPTGVGYLTVYGNAPQPVASNLNYTAGVNIANHTVAPISDVSSLHIFASKTTHVLVDIQGWTLPDFSYLKVLPAAKALRQGATRGLGVARQVPRRTTGG
jgi:hypothetical protein